MEVSIGIVELAESSKDIANRRTVKLMEVDTATQIGELKEVVVSSELPHPIARQRARA